MTDCDDITLPAIDAETKARIAEFVRKLEAKHEVSANEVGNTLETASLEYGVSLLPREVLFVLDVLNGVGVGTGLR